MIGFISTWSVGGERWAERVRAIVRRAGEMIRRAGDQPVERARTQTAGGNSRDRLRQVLNVVFAIGQIVTTFLTVVTGTEGQFTARSASEPPIIPAPYTFYIIWSTIYALAVAYAVYQALPGKGANELLRRVGFWTAPAFLGTSLWLLAASFDIVWLSAVIFFGILAALLRAMVVFVRTGAPRTAAERYLVVLPVSVYAGWATVATIANTATALTAAGFSNVLFADATWAALMLLVAGIIAALMTWFSRGNAGYALTIIWALVGVVVANAGEYWVVAAMAGSMALAVAATLVATRWSRRGAV